MPSLLPGTVKVKNLFRILLLLELLLTARVAFANPADYSVLGVITTTKDKKGVALMKHKTSGKVSAYKEGDEVAKGTIIKSILRKTVTFAYQGKLFELSVGDDKPKEVKEGTDSGIAHVASNLSHVEGIERQGDVLKVSKQLKDSLSSSEGLNKILMQAATVPYVENGRLLGFRLLEIEPGSIFDVAGFQNGDVVTEINGTQINDAGAAIRALNTLKNAPSATFSYLRGTTPMTLTIQIH